MGQTLCIGLALVTEQIERTHSDPGRRQTGQIVCHCQRKPAAPFVIRGVTAAQSGPGKPVLGPGPAKFSGIGTASGVIRAARPAVERRIGQDLIEKWQDYSEKTMSGNRHYRAICAGSALRQKSDTFSN